MVKWFRLFGEQYVGFWFFGLILFILQEVPYIVMPLLTLNSNPVMGMQETSFVLNFFEKVLGISCVLVMCFIVQKRETFFTIGSGINKAGFVLAILILLANYFGWMLYFSGYQSRWIILAFLVSLPPLYYAAIGLWRENWILLVLGITFGVVHFIHVYGNLAI
ncbi:MAG: hypothetical protein GX127_03765 [Eubacteriaceae bacterium]|jgi:hypothetical protein|nr:hypothetical protein [Eubacteriaceae bacterium]